MTDPSPYSSAAAPGSAPLGAEKPKTLSLISLIAGIVGMFFGTIFSIAAIVLGFLGRSREPHAKGFWLTGIILGFVGLVLSIIAIIVLVSLWAWIIEYGATTTTTY